LAGVTGGVALHLVVKRFMRLLEFIVNLSFVLSLLLDKIVTWIFLSRLRTLHASTWKQLGEPATMMTTFKLSRFLLRRDFNLLGDEKIAVIGRASRFFWLWSRGSFVLLIVVVILEAPKIFQQAYHR
jgi:hypothetical protein